MMDQSHNITDPIESLILSAIEIHRAYAKSLLIDHKILEHKTVYTAIDTALTMKKKLAEIAKSLLVKADKDYLLAGGVFTEDFIDNFIDIKYEEVQQLRQRPHPHEFFMYYDA